MCKNWTQSGIGKRGLTGQGPAKRLQGLILVNTQEGGGEQQHFHFSEPRLNAHVCGEPAITEGILPGRGKETSVGAGLGMEN